MSWNRSSDRQISADNDMEQGNDDELHALRSKITSIRGVTQDIYDDSRAQNSLLDGTGDAMDSFKTSLRSTSDRFTRVIQTSAVRNFPPALIIPAIVVFLFVCYKLLGGRKAVVPSDQTGGARW